MSTFQARTGHPIPAAPPILTGLSARALDILDRELDVCIQGAWGAALDEGDDFGFDVTGAYEVIRFATQGSGSIWGLWVGDSVHNLGADALATTVPVVHIDSEGSAACVAESLPGFFRVMLATEHLMGVCGYVGSSAIGEPEPADDEQVRKKRETVKELLVAWGAGGRLVSQEDLHLVARELGVELGMTENEAVDAVFAADFGREQKFRPPSEEDE